MQELYALIGETFPARKLLKINIDEEIQFGKATTRNDGVLTRWDWSIQENQWVAQNRPAND